MTTYLVLTVIGDDKPGLVESLAEIIAAHNGNWLESSMSQLAGKFAGILRVSVADDDADELISALDKLGNQLKLVIEKVSADTSQTEQRTARMSLVGNDRPGIIREISHCLAELGVNVEQLNTECASAPMSAGDLFTARAVLQIPVGVELERLQSRLEQLADELIVDISLE